MNWIFARLAEPSTWAGIGVFATHISAAVATHDPVAVVATVAGALAAIKSESTGNA
jgi:hypothetical protein